MTGEPATIDPRRAREAGLRPMGPRGEGWIGLQMVLEIGILVIAPFTGPAWGGPARLVTTVVGPGAPRHRCRRLRLGRLAPRCLVLDLGDAAPGRPAGNDRALPLRAPPDLHGPGGALPGVGAVAASPVGLLLVPVVAWYLDRYKLAREEQTLLAKYPEYPAYMRAVPHRMLPVPPRRLVPSDPAGV